MNPMLESASKSRVVTVSIIGKGRHAHLDMGNGQFLYFDGAQGFRVEDYGYEIDGTICRNWPLMNDAFKVIRDLRSHDHDHVVDWNSEFAQFLSMYCTDVLARSNSGRKLLEDRSGSIDEFLSEVCLEYYVKPPVSVRSFLDKVEIIKYDMMPDFDKLIGGGIYYYSGAYSMMILQKDSFILITKIDNTFIEYLYPMPIWFKSAIEAGCNNIYLWHATEGIVNTLKSIAGTNIDKNYKLNVVRPDKIGEKYELRNYLGPWFHSNTVTDFYYGKPILFWPESNKPLWT